MTGTREWRAPQLLQTTEGGVLIRVDRLFCNWIGYAADQLVAPHGTTFSIVCPAA